METILRTHRLVKTYRGRIAVRDVSMTIERGEIYGLLGPNGAGKSTTLRMIVGLVWPTAGEIELFGETLHSGNRHRLLERVGATMERPGFYGNLTALENLRLHARLMGMEDERRFADVLERVGLQEEKNRLVRQFSLGMRQRLAIARALLHHPELLVLDEPTNGLDPAGIKALRQLLSDLVQTMQITVLLSSHMLSEVQQLATKIGILVQGRLVEEISAAELERRNRHYLELKVSDEKKAAVLLEQKLGISDYRVMEPGMLRIYERLSESGVINRTLVTNGVDVRELVLMRDSLEDYFLQLTGGTGDA